MALEFCPSCDASLRRDSRFCGNCGTETASGFKTFRAERKQTRQDLNRRALVIALTFCGPIVAMLLASWRFDEILHVLILHFLASPAICLLGTRLLGPGTLRHSLGRRPDLKALALGVAVPALSLPVAIAYVSLLPGPEGAESASELSELGFWVLILIIAVHPALVEEWLCRGVLWVALRQVVSSRLTIFVSATLFAILHGLNGGLTLELPHRFVMGLLLGWLRAKTGSIWPCVLAHFLHNAVAVALMD